MKRRMLALFLALFLGIALTGCADVQSNNGPYKMYLIAKSTTTEFWKSVFAGANAAKSEYNVDLTVLGPDTEENYEAQNEYIRQAVADGADAIVFSAISYAKNAQAIDEAADAGVKVVVIDSDVNSSGVVARIGTDNAQAGRMSAKAALDTEELDSIVVGIVNCDVETQNCQERERGFRVALAADPRVQDIYTVNVPTDAELARQAARGLLLEHPDINVLVGFNEPLAVGTAHGGRRAGAERAGARDCLRHESCLRGAFAEGRGVGAHCPESLRDGLSRRGDGVAEPAGRAL